MTNFLNKLPDCIIDKIYQQPKYLLEYIKSYVLFMNFVNSGHMNIMDLNII